MEEIFWPDQTPQPPGIYQPPLFFFCIFTWFISHLWLTYVLSRHLGKLLTPGFISMIPSVWGNTVVVRAVSLWARWWHRAGQLWYSAEDELFLKFFVHQNRRKKMNSLEQRIHTKCEELDEFAWARRPSLEQHLQLETSLFKTYSNPKTSWCFALVKLSCGRNHYDFTLRSLIVTLISTFPPGIRFYFWFTILVGRGVPMACACPILLGSLLPHTSECHCGRDVSFKIYPFQLFTQNNPGLALRFHCLLWCKFGLLIIPIGWQTTCFSFAPRNWT